MPERMAAEKRARDGKSVRDQAERGLRLTSQRIENPAVVISRRAADHLRAGHVWVYRSDVVEFPAGAPRLVSVVDQRGILLGTALYSSVSEIPLRLISTDAIAGEGEWLEL